MIATQDMADRDAGARAFWTFSLDYYARDEVRDASLALQDRFGANVNLLFLCIWLATLGARPLRSADFATLQAAVEHWQISVIKPLRRVRQDLKSIEDAEAAAVYESLKSSELDAERAEQAVLSRFAKELGLFQKMPGGDAADIASQSLALYLAKLGVAGEDAHAWAAKLVKAL